MSGDQGGIHYENPFATPSDKRDPLRQLRGALVAPVTIWTAGAESHRAGLTVSSMVVAEGDPGVVAGLIGPLTDLYDRIKETGRFVVHVLSEEDRRLSEIFAGLRPAPGGPFSDLAIEDEDAGPVITSLPIRARCSLLDDSATGYHRLVRGSIDSLDVPPIESPLVFFRGRYRGLAPD